MKFDCIVLDPPWQYDNKNTGGSLISGADKKYPTMSYCTLLELKSFIEILAKKDCIIYMWVTNSFLEQGLELVSYYGFTYKTLITWVKQNGKGLGYWYRGNTEHMILGIKGNIKAFHSQQINVFHSETKEHSQKPIKAYELIEEGTKSIKDCKVLEIFARRQYKNWICIGMDLDGLDIFDSLEIVLKK